MYRPTPLPLLRACRTKSLPSWPTSPGKPRPLSVTVTPNRPSLFRTLKSTSVAWPCVKAFCTRFVSTLSRARASAINVPSPLCVIARSGQCRRNASIRSLRMIGSRKNFPCGRFTKNSEFSNCSCRRTVSLSNRSSSGFCPDSA